MSLAINNYSESSGKEKPMTRQSNPQDSNASSGKAFLLWFEDLSVSMEFVSGEYEETRKDLFSLTIAKQAFSFLLNERSTSSPLITGSLCSMRLKHLDSHTISLSAVSAVQ